MIVVMIAMVTMMITMALVDYAYSEAGDNDGNGNYKL